MDTQPKIIGFDIRKPMISPGSTQTHDNITEPFKPKTKPLITFDKYVCPSVFIPKNKSGPSKKLSNSKTFLVKEGINSGFDLFMLWDDIMDMMVNYPGDGSDADAAFAYAWIDLSKYGVSAPADDTFDVLTNRQIHPPYIPEDSILLGYDIVSTYFISSLSGFDHSQSRPGFVGLIRPYINCIGLVSAKTTEPDLAMIAAEIQKEIDEDIFFVVAIYLLWDNSNYILTDCAKT